jgi:NADP-dependent 3-hydroxy acid dehydrogenase YdfG
MQVQNQTALVTGASSGIGKVTAVRLAEKGFDVIAAARRLERLNALADQHPGITAKQVDLSRPEDTQAFCRYLADLPQPVSVLVNNAGYSTRGVLEDVALADIKRLFEVNLFALIRVTQACLPAMRKMRKGTIVNLSSIVGKFSFPGSGVYASSKYAVEGITDALRTDLAPFGIRVVAIRPGAIGTEFNEVADKMTGDLMARTDPDYKPFYETAKAAVGKMFENRSVADPELIADLILEAVLADTPKAAYAAGPLSKEFLGNRAKLDDDGFHRFMLEKFDLAGLKL